jgi:subtilase family serine protease
MMSKRKITHVIVLAILSLFILANFTGAFSYAYDNKDVSIELKNSLHPMLNSAQITPYTTTISNFTPDMIRTAYNLKNIYNAGINGSGVTIGILTIIENESNNIKTALNVFSSHYNIPISNDTLKMYLVSDTSFSPSKMANYSDNINETELDVEWAHAIAPGAKIIVFGIFGYRNIELNKYYNDNYNIKDEEVDSWLTQALHDIVNGYFYITPNNNISIPKINILSFSYAGSESSFSQNNISSIDSSIKKFTDNGGIFFSASGDYGSYEQSSNPRGPEFPATDPYVVSVGGSEIYNINNLYEQGWKLSGGGWSNIFNWPPWQNNTKIKPSNLNGWKNNRLVPDVSANSVNMSFVITWVYGHSGQSNGISPPGSGGGGGKGGPGTPQPCLLTPSALWQVGKGTSFATPMWAGIGALALEYANFIKYHNPGVYLPPNKSQMFSYFLYQNNSILYKGFNDITKGDNYGFSCTAGWDAVTGWGSPNGSNLVRNYAYYSTKMTDSLIYGKVTLNGHILANYPVYISYTYDNKTYTTVNIFTDKNGYYYFDDYNFTNYKTNVFVKFYSYKNSSSILIEKSTIYNVNFNINTNDSVQVSIYGPSSASPNMIVSFTVSGVDSENYKLMYTVKWSEGSNKTTNTTTGYCPSGATITISHSWSNTGTFNITVIAIAESFKTATTYTSIYITNSSSGGGSGGGGSCVYGLTPILMWNNTYKLAKDIKVGDTLMTFNFTTGEMEYGTVEYITITHWSLMYVIDGYLMVAPDQAVWTERGYVNAENLTLNDTIYNVFTNSYMPVFSIKILHGSFTMYDFTVSVNGNYIAYWDIMKDLGGIHAC